MDEGNNKVRDILNTENFTLVLFETQFPLGSNQEKRSLIGQETENGRFSKYSRKDHNL